MRGRRTIVENMPQMRVAFPAAHFGPAHAVARVAACFYILFRDGRPEAWPAGAGFKLGLRTEQRVPTAEAAIYAWIVKVVVLPAKRALGARAARLRKL